MIDNAIENLFTTIDNSKEYNEYKKIVEILEKDEEVKKLIEEIKVLQKESVNLEYKDDAKYKEIDKVIEEKVKLLNENKSYQDYLKKLREFNKALLSSSSLIEEYVNDVV